MRLLRPTTRRVRRATRLALVIATTALAGGCVDWGGPDGDTDAFSIAHGLWQDANLTSYDYVIQRRCISCPSDRASRRVTVTVRNDAVVERVYTGSTDPVPASEATYYPTVDGLFVELEQMLRTAADVNRVAYSASLGYPLSVLIVPRGQSEEAGWEISSLTPATGSAP